MTIALGRALSVEYRQINSLKPNPLNARKHPKHQIQRLATAICTFGFLVPILVARDGTIMAGHGRVEAAKRAGLTTVPVILIEHLTNDQARAFIIADNKLTEAAEWDRAALAVEFQHLINLDSDLDVTSTGFDIPEIDLIIEEASSKPDPDDRIDAGENSQQVTQPGDVWNLGPHSIVCADALDQRSYDAVLRGRKADVVFTDAPYNVRIEGHASGNGRTRHREFPMASGEMSEDAFQVFLMQSVSHLAANSCDGSVHYLCMDWGHARTLLDAAKPLFRLLNICVWVKNNGGMGSFYRSQHELVFVFKNGTGSFRNNIQLGRFGRNRTNVWTYPSPSAFGRAGEEGNLAALHPTVKPVAMIADAILDCSARGDIVLDSFLGSGSTLLAAERVGRVCCGIELDPLYIDVAVRRWQRYTGDAATHALSGKRFDDFVEAVHV